MRRPVLFLSAVVLPALLACGEAPPPAAPPAPAPAPAPTPTQTAPAPTASAEPQKTPEEIKKEEAQKELAADFAKLEESHKAEMARWTPELRAAAKALADKAYPTGKAAIQAMLAGKHRKPGNADRDKYRHPAETLAFFGFQPNMTVLDIGPGEGWYTELLAPALAKKGHYLATNGDPAGPADQRGTYYAKRFKLFTETSPEAYGKIETITIGKAPKLEQQGTIDMVLILRGVHGMKTSGTFPAWLAEIHHALKPNGVLAITEHRAAPGADPDETAKKGYLPEKWVIDTIEAAGFKLAGKSEINANAKDTKDYPDGVWDLPPTLRMGDKDKDKYLAIGESDRMTLKFVKVAQKAEKPAKPEKAGAPEKATKPAKPADKPAPKK
jgi:predicted methyltransferase